MMEVELHQPESRDGINNYVRVVSEISIPPRQRMVFQVSVENIQNNTCGIIEPNFSLIGKHNVVGARCLVQTQNRKTWFEIVNPTNSKITICENSIVGNFTTLIERNVLGELNDTMGTICNISFDNSRQESNIHYQNIAKDMGIDLSNSDLNNTQKSQLLTLLGKYRHAFAKDLSELGCTDVHQHIVDTGNANPIRQHPYRTTPKMKAEIDQQIDDMESRGIIRKRISPWASPVVMVKKSNGEYRFAVDYRKLNAVTKIFTTPLPQLHDVIDTLGTVNSTIFSVCDMRQGFWQLQIDEPSREKTAFVTHRGQYEFNRLPYGLANSPATFSMVMNEVIREMNWKNALVYVDDILVFSQNFDQHLVHLSALFDKLIEANLRLKPSKCQFACKEVRYLGHVISKEGIAVDPEKTTSIKSFKAPRNIKEVRMFLGLCNYYRKFIQNHSKITAPLTQLLQKDHEFEWTTDCQKALDMLKQKLTSPPILIFPDFEKEFVLQTDASGTAIGYVLGQHDNNKNLRIIAYGGRMLRKPEQKWDVKDRECLALVTAIKQFHVYLANTKFQVYTDHIALQYLKRIKESTGRLARWSIYLQGYNFEVQYKPGREMVCADFLSRIHHEPAQRERRLSIDFISASDNCTRDNKTVKNPSIEQTGVTQDDSKITIGENTEKVTAQTPAVSAFQAAIEAEDHYLKIDPIAHVLQTTAITIQQIKEAQRNDEEIRQMCDYIQNDEIPQDNKTADLVIRESNHYVVSSDGILFHMYHPRGKGHMSERCIRQLVVPKSLRNDVLLS